MLQSQLPLFGRYSCRQAGNVVHADVMLNPDGTSKGWGVVQYASAQDALGAIQVGMATWCSMPHLANGSHGYRYLH